MNDILIPYLKNNSGELETCIKLIKKNFPHNNIHILTEFNKTRYSNFSHVNQILKLDYALKNINITKDFYLFNDDFFVMKPVESVPYYYKSTLYEHYVNTRWREYKEAIKNTIDIIGWQSLSYEVHMPMLMNKEKLEGIIAVIKPYLEIGKCPLVRSMYGNMYNVPGELADDVKNPVFYHGRTFLSTNEKSYRGELGNYIRSKV